MGVCNNNPLLDSSEYEVEFPDGETDTFTENLIAKNMMSQVDAEEYSYSILSEIIDHCSDGNDLSKDDAYISTMLHFLIRRNALVDGLELLKLALISWPDLYSQTPANLLYISMYGYFQMKINKLTQPKLQ